MGKAELCAPGGCEIGLRPIDLHLSALRSMGVEIDESDLSVDFTVGELWRFVHDTEENADL